MNPRLKSSVREIRTLGSVGVGLLEVSSPSTRRRGLITRPYSIVMHEESEKTDGTEPPQSNVSAYRARATIGV